MEESGHGTVLNCGRHHIKLAASKENVMARVSSAEASGACKKSLPGWQQKLLAVRTRWFGLTLNSKKNQRLCQADFLKRGNASESSNPFLFLWPAAQYF
jgi:hypothetical protein